MRSFGLIVLGFVAMVAVFAAVFTWQVRSVRSYAGRVLSDASRVAGPYSRNCTALSKAPPPSTPQVQSCQVTRAASGRVSVQITLASGRTYVAAR